MLVQGGILHQSYYCRYGALGVRCKALYPLLDTAEPIGKAGGASGITYLRMGKKHQKAVRSEGKKVCEHQDQRIRRQKRYSPWRNHREAGISLQTMERTMVEKMSTAAHGGPHAGAAGYFLKELKPVESPHREKLIVKDGSPRVGLTLEQ